MSLECSWHRFAKTVFAVVFAAQCPPAMAEKVSLNGFPPIESYTLPNGLQVLLWPDASTTLVAGNVWFRSGGLHERPGVTGVAHLFEHMMFRPSRHAPNGVLEVGSAWAADTNATTKYKSTNYDFDLPADKVEDYLRLEADRMVHLPVNAEMLAKEKEAVRSEYLNWDNTPLLVLLPVLARNLFPGHIAGSFVTGERADLDKITAKDCTDFYRSNYSPNNATLILAGGFSFDRAKKLVAKYFGSLPKSRPAESPPDPKEWPAAKLVNQDVPGNAHYLALGYPVPFFRPESRGLSLAMHMLFSGKESLVGRKLVVEDKVAAEVDINVDGLGWPVIIVVLNRGEDVQKALDAVDGVVKATSTSLSPESLKRYAVSFQASLLRALQSPAQRANTLGLYLSYKDGLVGLKNDLNASAKIGVADVKAALDAFIRPANRVAVYGKPRS